MRGFGEAGKVKEAMEHLGPRLKEVRTAANLSVREVARQLNVSPSFVSQIENGKSQPSVRTLYQIAQLLGVTIDVLFAPDVAPRNNSHHGESAVRDQMHDPADIWNDSKASISTVSPHTRGTITMETGVKWQRLAATADHKINFMEIVYPAGSTSNHTGEFLIHDGFEYGYALEGEVEITIGDAVLNLSKGHSIGFDSRVPHIIRNVSALDFHGIWFVHSCPLPARKSK